MRMILACLGLASIAFAPSALAEVGPHFFIKGGTRQIADSNLALVSNSDVISRFELGAGLDLSRSFRLEFAGTYSGSSAPLFDGAATASLSMWGVQGTALLSTPLLPWLGAFGRGGAILEFPVLSMEAGGEEIDQMRLVPTLLATAGLEMAISIHPEKQDAYFAVSLEGGYLFSPFDADFDGLTSHRDPDTKPLPPGAVPAGTLDLSGWLIQLGLGMHF